MKKRLDHIYTYWGVISNAVLAWMVVGMLVLFTAGLTEPPVQRDSRGYIVAKEEIYWSSDRVLNASMTIVGLMTVWSLYTVYRKRQRIKTRAQTIAALARRHDFQYTPQVKNKIRSKNFMLITQRDANVTNSLSTDDWIYGELSYDRYRRIKGGEYKSDTVYYSLLEVPLSRKLPNMFFDGFKAHGQQFHWLIDSQQITSLEGDFDSYFITYFPEQYHIDARSVISPEVMQAMIDIYPVDIEICGDSLFIYSALLPTDEITTFTKKAIKIRDVMMDNAECYVDTLVSGADKKDVSVYGAELSRRNVFPWLIIMILLVYSVPLYVGETSSSVLQKIIRIVVIVAVTGYEVYRWLSVRRASNAKRKALYEKVTGLRRKNLR